MSDKPRKGNVAFWSYDQYPYMIGAKIECAKLREYPKRGQSKWVVMCEGFTGYWFPATVVLAPALGVRVKNQLAWLKEQRRAAMDKVAGEYDRTLISLLEDSGRSAAIVDKIVPDHAKPCAEAVS